MNKHLHRIVFNAARGMRMVVQETARSAGKANGATSAVLATALLAALPAPAQIVGAPGVSPGLRATVLVAPNGVPVVNIQTPSAAGVSRNLYHQFDVQPRGVILNNSRTDVQTQLGGRVQANPFLATGPARIILNEVVSGNPTHLRGAIEVGGQRAEVIVANPAGIAVDGGTFINITLSAVDAKRESRASDAGRKTQPVDPIHHRRRKSHSWAGRCPTKRRPLLFQPVPFQENAMAHEKYAACISACNDCAMACSHCAAACLHEDDVKMMAACIALDMDCAAICQLAAAAMARDSAHAPAICRLCAEICTACGAECAKHSHAHCQACAEACRRCAEACRQMAA